MDMKSYSFVRHMGYFQLSAITDNLAGLFSEGTFLGVGWWLLLLVMSFPEDLYQHTGPHPTLVETETRKPELGEGVWRVWSICRPEEGGSENS